MNLKHITVAALLATTTTTLTHAEDWYFEPYIGADIDYIAADYKSRDGINYGEVFGDTFVGGNIHAGARVHQHMGVEVGYTRTTKSNQDFSQLTQPLGVNGESDLQLSGWNVDVHGYYPVSADGKTEAIGSIGIARWKEDAEYTISSGTLSASASEDESDTFVRYGIGLQHKLDANFNARGMVRYMPVDFDGVTDHLLSIGVGVNYAF